MRIFLFLIYCDLLNVIEFGFKISTKLMNEQNDFKEKIFYLNAKVINSLFCTLERKKLNRIFTYDTIYDI